MVYILLMQGFSIAMKGLNGGRINIGMIISSSFIYHVCIFQLLVALVLRGRLLS